MDTFQNCNTLLTSLNVRISRVLEQLHRVELAKSAQVTNAAKDDWSRAVQRCFTFKYIGFYIRHFLPPLFS
jgi:hypothetical protein